jgi:hypothetical protein
MNEEPRRKKRSEKLSDAMAARLSRESAPTDLPSARRDSRRSKSDKGGDRPGLAKMGTQQAHSFTRCPHCREYVPIREQCRSCGTPMS